MNPNSRSPWAAWLRFMKSMSMSAQGISRLYWVWRWRNGFASSCRPAIHIFAGLNVCIHVIRPTHAGSAFASAASCRIPSEPVSTGLATMRTGIDADSSSAAAICRAWSATWSSVSGPYRCWLPVTNQTSDAARFSTW